MRIVRFKNISSFFILSFMLILLCSQTIASLPSVEGGALDTPPSQPPSMSVNAEQDNVESWNVHPASGRWLFVEDTGLTDIISNGMLNISDTGDGTLDRYRIERKLRKLDSKIETRFRLRWSGSSFIVNRDIFTFAIGSATDLAGGNFILEATGLNDTGSFINTSIAFRDQDGASQKHRFTEDSELIQNNTWYRLIIKYNILKSEIQFTLFQDTTQIWKVREFEIIGDSIPLLFSETGFRVTITQRGESNGNFIETLIDYIDAPFKEHEWENVEVPVGFLGNAWDSARAEDDIDDQSKWRLNVPFLDTVSGLMSIDYTNFGNFVGGDGTIFVFRIQAADADDGGLHELLEVQLRLEHSIGPSVAVGIRFSMTMDGVETYSNQFNIADGDIPGVSFSTSLSQDRSEFTAKARYFFDVTDSTAGYDDVSGSIDIASVADDPSQEFVLEFEHSHDYDGNIEMTSFVTDFAFVERDIFTDLIGGVQGFFETLILSVVNIFVAVFRFIAGIFVFVGDIIVIAVVALGVVLTVALTALGTLLEAAIEALEPFLTVISDAVDALWTLFIDTLDDIVTALIALASDFTEFFFDVLELLIPLIITFLGTILSSIVDLAAAALFFLWDALSLPDLLGILDLIVVHSVTFITEFIAALTDIIQLLIDVSWIPLVVWWAYAVPFQFAKAAFEPLAGLGNTIEVYFQNLIPVSVLGFRLYFPIGVFATVWLIVLLPADFIGFTALP